MLKDYLKYWKLLLVFAISYPIFILTRVCPISQDLSQLQIESVQPFTYQICLAGNKVLYPVVSKAIIPNYEYFVKPQIIKLDNTIAFTKTVNDIKFKYNSIEQKFQIHRKINFVSQKIMIIINKLNYNYFVYLHPTVTKYWSLFQLKTQYYIKLGFIQIKYHLSIVKDKFLIIVERFSDYVGYKLSQWFDKVKAIEFIAKILNWLDQIFDKLLSKTREYSFYDKKEFLKAEFKNLTRFNQFYRFNSSINLVELVNNLLHDAQQKFSSVGDTFKGEKSEFEQKLESELELEHEEEIEEENENELFDDVIEELENNNGTLDSIEEETFFETPQTSEIQEDISPVEITIDTTSIDEIDSDDYDESEDEGPFTIKLTSTITITQDAVATDEISVDNVSDDIKQINQELFNWEKKVNNTINLATKNLELELKPKLDKIFDEIKPIVTEKLTNIQIKNYQNYQNLNKKILEINRDYEKIYSSNDTSIETISRQEIRDDIKEAYEFDEESIEQVQLTLIVNHESILKEYFLVLQDTIDILESFSETAVGEFTKKFTNTLEELQVDDEVLWNSWKTFYKIKDKIFEYRNNIYNAANDYKTRDIKSLNLDVVGLNEWNEYVTNINFHLKFITDDNDEYMKLIRAQANIAFQSREELVRKIENEKQELIRKQELEKLEQEKLAQLKEKLLVEELKKQIKVENLNETERIIDQIEDFTEQPSISDSTSISTTVSTSISTSISTTISTSLSIIHESIKPTDENFEDHLSDDEKTDDEVSEMEENQNEDI